MILGDLISEGTGRLVFFFLEGGGVSLKQLILMVL